MEPESDDMKQIKPMGMLVCSNFWAVMMGPMALVCRWKANSSKELGIRQIWNRLHILEPSEMVTGD